MKIVADANIPLLAEAFGPLGEVAALPADRITPESVADADALLVRSVTCVGGDLLDSSRVRFVATATIGLDHIDQAYLAERGIGFASAQGSNARSVAEYVLAALSILAERGRRDMTQKVLGIVGCGNVGGRLGRMAEAIGLRVLQNDPPLARTTHDPRYVPIEALAEADVVTFHVPLACEGPDATYHMISESLLGRLKRGVAVINTSRGAVAGLLGMMRNQPSRHLGITPDGPRGPRRVVQDGAVYLASRTGMPLVPAGYAFDGCRRAGSWDKMALPRPFRRAVGVIGGPIIVPPDLDRAGSEACRIRMQEVMDRVQKRAEQLAAAGKIAKCLEPACRVLDASLVADRWR